MSLFSALRLPSLFTLLPTFLLYCNPATSITGNEANRILKSADTEGIVLCYSMRANSGQQTFLFEPDIVDAKRYYDRAGVQKCADERRIAAALSPVCGLVPSLCKPDPVL